MHQTPKIVIAPVDEPISIEEARAHLEAQPYEDSDVDPIDDTMIAGYLAAAREWCEDFLGLSLSTRTIEIARDTFPTSRSIGGMPIELAMGPVREIVSIFVPLPDGDPESGDADSDALAGASIYADGQVNPDLYLLDDYRSPARVVPVTAWPAITAATNAVKIRYLAGYGVDSDGGEALPWMIRSAILLLLAHLYENRGDLAEIPPAVTTLLRPRRVRLGMA